MSILDNTSSSLTLAQKQRKAKSAVVIQSKVLFEKMLDTFNEGMANVWANEDGLTPAQVLAGFGTDAKEIVAGASSLKAFINAVKPNTITAATPATLVEHDDGTVTIAA